MENIVFIAHDVYSTLGAGYNEVVYHRAFEVGLRLNNIKYESEVITPVFYKGFSVGHGRVDIKLDNIIIEFKAISSLNNDAVIQIKNYMKYYGYSEGLIINFGQATKSSTGSLEIKYINNDKIYEFDRGVFQEITF